MGAGNNAEVCLSGALASLKSGLSLGVILYMGSGRDRPS